MRFNGRFSEYTAGLILVGVIFCGCGSVSAVKKPLAQIKAEEAAVSAADAFASGDTSRAIDKFKEAVRLDRTIDDRESELRDLINLSRAYLLEQNPDMATEYVNDAVRIALTLKNDERLSDAYATLSSACYAKGEYEAALRAINSAEAIDDRIQKRSGAKLNIKGNVLIAMGRRAEAELACISALNQAGKEGALAEAANADRTLGYLSAGKSAYAEAFDFYSKAYEIDKSLGNSARIADDLAGMAEARFSQSKTAEATGFLERAYTVNQSAGRESAAIANLDRLIIISKSAGDEPNVARFTALRQKLANKEHGNRTNAK
jgi:tetratricopeptide (TPR) repeat protein